MIFHILTIFPAYFESVFRQGIVAKAIESGTISLRMHDLRNWTNDRHRTVDDRPFGGGEGMVLKVEPVFLAVQSIFPDRDPRRHRVVLLSAQGRRFEQSIAREHSAVEELLLICGRYEGVDERIATFVADDEISVGDFILSGGELAAAMVVDVVARLVPGVLGNAASAQQESFSAQDAEGNVLLDCPHYTRPADFNGWRVPEVLLQGNHAEIERWRAQVARAKREKNRPDLLGPKESRTQS